MLKPMQCELLTLIYIVTFGIGNEVTEFTQLASSFFEANEAYENALLNNQREFISDYHSKDIKELLQLIPKETCNVCLSSESFLVEG